MFLKKLFGFNRDYKFYLDKGDKYMAVERYADARNSYIEGMERLDAEGSGECSLIEEVNGRIARAGNMLGQLNLVEAEHAISCGELKRAGEYLQLILELADNQSLREKAERLLNELENEPSTVQQVKPSKNCGSCKVGMADTGSVELDDIDDDMTDEDRLTLYYHSLPSELFERYSVMGAHFDNGCLLRLKGKVQDALKVFEALAEETENDIICYEMALLKYESGDVSACQRLLTRAVSLNPLNPLAAVSLVHLHIEAGKLDNAMLLLQRMITDDVVTEQALLMQGDLYVMLQNESDAIECFSRLLQFPKTAKPAAERLIPILQKQGRDNEAEFLFKKYAKGCC